VTPVPKLGLLLGLLFVGACGARSGLGSPDASTEFVDARGDVSDASVGNIDAHQDAGDDSFSNIDAHQDAGDDSFTNIDAHQDGPVTGNCPDAGSTLIYVITQQNELFSFYPPTLAFGRIGTIACPVTDGATPYSMAVDRRGIAYSVFTDGQLFRIDTANAACSATAYQARQMGEPFYNFGMGYAGDQLSEFLYVTDSRFGGYSTGLATIDTRSFTLSFIADFQPELPRCELTGTGDGRLFAFCLPISGNGAELFEIDRGTARVIATNRLALGSYNYAFAFAFWGGYFWIFTSPGGASTVTRYDPQTLTETEVASLGSTIVGAGVSTCAPL
jgi:hypothetical protein